MCDADPSGARPADAHGELRSAMAALLPDLRAFARFLVRDRTAADDLVQDCLVRALAALEQFEPGTNLKAWLFTILRNGFYETGRKRRREVVGLPERQAAGARPDAEVRAEMRHLEGMIWALPPLLREALILVGAQEMSYDEAATVCAVPVGTMKARVSRARTALGEAMRREERNGDDGHEPG